MTRWLTIAEWLCGEHARRTVFEPLVADWQREWREAPQSGWSRALVLVSGPLALSVAISYYALTGGLVMTRTALLKASAAVVISTLALLGIQVGLQSMQFRADYLFEIRVWLALPMILPLAVPLAMLPMMMLLRGAGVTARAATVILLAGGALTLITTGLLAPLAQADVISDRLDEAMYQRAVENDRAGRYTYPWSAVRQLKPTTPEQRAEQRRKWRSDPRYLAAQAERTRPRWSRSTFMTAALTIAIGVLGWGLGGLGRTRVIHATAWWALACLALLVFDGRLTYWLNNYGRPRAPFWGPLAVFGTAALLMLFFPANRREAPTP
jgi:hypothetical protein